MKAWTKRVSGALLLLLGIALGARLIFALLVPVLPLLVVGVVMSVVYGLVFGRYRR